MRLLVAGLSVAVLLAACTGHPPAQTPITPWSADKATPMTTSDASAAASTTPAGAPGYNLTCQPNMPTDDPTSWMALAPEGAGFSARLPGPALETTTEIETPAGKVPMKAWAFLDGCSRVFAVTHLRFAAGALSKAGSTTQILDTVVAFQAQGQQGASIAQSDATVSGSPGRRFTISGGDSLTEGLAVVAGDDIYLALVAGDAGRPLPAAATDAFLAAISLGA